MKQNEISDLPPLRSENYENLFNVYQDEKDNMYYYNILQTIQFPDKLPPTLFNNYNVQPGDTWPYIAYKSYDSPNLWWPIMFANKILNPVKNPVPGTTILIPKIQVVNEMLVQIGKKR